MSMPAANRRVTSNVTPPPNDTAGVSFDPDELVPESFRTIDMIAQKVASKAADPEGGIPS